MISIIRGKIFLFLLAASLTFSIALINGCDDSGIETKFVNNPNVKVFDSLYIEEDSAAGQSFAGLNLLDGFNTTSTSASRDIGMAGGLDSLGTNFYFRSGIFDFLAPGYETRFFRYSADMPSSDFDTISFLNVGGELDSTDFTQEDTYANGVWSYFNTPLTTYPVYAFYLRGRKAAGENNNIRVYGIFQPITSGDRVLGSPYGFWMTIKARININAENDFRRQIEQ
ncbi:MAG: hypothetical protein L0Y79_08140 [Chlorobi bacterium]|nr:hypothetical protein [Chlorobiota bacterium]MCI0715462.1 hypothetical protein [Chlorobiota bacterium]